MAKGQFPKGSFPGWRTMTKAERYNAKLHLIFDRARANGAFDPPPVETLEKLEARPND